MNQVEKEVSLKSLQVTPGVGKSIALDLYNLGYRSPGDLRGNDPELMYARSCALAGTKLDRCVLYTYRCAVYFAQTKNPDPEKLKWWNWKD
jgi:hypothetical protein